MKTVVPKLFILLQEGYKVVNKRGVHSSTVVFKLDVKLSHLAEFDFTKTQGQERPVLITCLPVSNGESMRAINSCSEFLTSGI